MLGESGDETLLCGEVTVGGVGVQVLFFLIPGVILGESGDETLLCSEVTVCRVGIQWLRF